MIDITTAASLYNRRFELYGRDIKTVGWGNEDSQHLRFEVLFRGLDPKGKTILDVGCGLGDLIPYLDRRTNGDFKYIGIDIAEKLIKNAVSTYGGEGREFYVGDIFSLKVPDVDISILSGALSFKTSGIEEYARETMRIMFEFSREAASLNFLTKYVDFELEKNQHYQPEAVYSWSKKLSKRVNLIDDYPLYEFTIQILRPVI
jgi:ubiquinone/menaquinone biosynthesis C-methylase UbiE